MYQSGKEALESIYRNIEEQVKKEVEKENQRIENETIKESSSVPLAPLEQHTIAQIQNMQNQPVMVYDSLRDDLVALQNLLKANGKNPELLEKVESDIEFFDKEVLKHVVDLIV